LQKAPIHLNDYRRIFNTIYSILTSENAELNHSCLFYSLFGALILNTHYNIKAKAFAGFAVYKFGKEEEELLVFAEESDGKITSTENGFHSWIETEEWYIDLFAPQFPKLLESMGQRGKCKAKMFQKHFTAMADSPNNLKVIGDFYFHPNIELTNELVDHFVGIQGYIDLANICNQWYRIPPQKMLQTVPVSDGRGNTNIMRLHDIPLAGDW